MEFKKYKRQRTGGDAERSALAHERGALVHERLEALESGTAVGGLKLNEMTFRPQKGESICGAVLCYRKQLKTETTGVTFGGPSVRLKIAKGVYYVDDDPRVLTRIMEIASGEQPALESDASLEQLN